MVHHQLRSHWKLDHVGHVVLDLNTAESDFVERLGFSVELRETVESQAVELVFLTLGGLTLELLAPLPGNTSLRKFIDRRGPGLHHVAFAVPSVSAELRSLETQGIIAVDREPRLGSRGHHVAFLHPKATQNLLIELCGDR